MRPTVAEISLPRLRANYRAIQSAVGDRVAVMAVVKANAYGHGSVPVSLALADEGAPWFGVCCVEEAIPLRRAGITQPILLLSGYWPGQEEAVVAERLVPAVFDEEQLAALENALASRESVALLPFHLKVNTGLGRLGLDVTQLGSFLARLRTCRHLCLEGLFTHFASADDATAPQTALQIEMLQRALGEMRRANLEPRLFHAAATAAIPRYPGAHGNMVRPGIGLYGYQPGADDAHRLGVEPVLALKSRIMSLRWVPADTPLGYGATYNTRTRARVACVPAGYADGINRLLSNRGRALVRGQPVPIVGRVSMDLTLLDVTPLDAVDTGDEVVFIGRQGDSEITADDVARWAGTISYEILCNISPRVPRVHLRD